MAAFNLGLLHRDGGRLEDAARTYQLAIDSGHEEAAPMAAFNLGVLHEAEGRPEDAARTYQLAIDSGHEEILT
jgi:tetratricopeptide (TPR) repeat protein